MTLTLDDDAMVHAIITGDGLSLGALRVARLLAAHAATAGVTGEEVERAIAFVIMTERDASYAAVENGVERVLAIGNGDRETLMRVRNAVRALRATS